MTALALGVKFNATSSGAGDFVYASAVTGNQSPSSAGMVDGAFYRYRAETADLTQWEFGSGVWTASTSTLARTTVAFSSTGSKVAFSAAPQVGATIFPADVRDKLTAARSYFVNGGTGSDSNSGLASGAAFATLQKAADTIAALDIATFNVTVNVADGTYTGGVVFNGPILGTGTVSFVGNTTTPANCFLNLTNAYGFQVNNGAAVTLSGFKIACASNGSALRATAGGRITVNGKMEFGACAYNHFDVNNAVIGCSGVTYTISGGAGAHWAISQSGAILAQSNTVTLSGTPAFTAAFATVDATSSLVCNASTFTGSATGSRYTVSGCSYIQTFGSGASYLPGNAAGTNPTGGQYS